MTPDEAATESSAGKDTVTDKNSMNTSSSLQVKLCYLKKPKISLNVITVILNQNRREVSRHILATNINNLKTWR